ncbi:MAG: hypothetical protein DLM68_07065 [Hyphomicrobiales bacterium]|nr:MAG: hypothetical protein DLM68_07065 [Hyphomicrobiales bacterium]
MSTPPRHVDLRNLTWSTILLGYEPTINSHTSDVPSLVALWGGGEIVAASSLDETDGKLPDDSS